MRALRSAQGARDRTEAEAAAPVAAAAGPVCDSSPRMRSAALLPLVLLGPACTGALHGDGNPQRALRELAPFRAVVAHGAIDVHVRFGEVQRVEIATDGNLIARVRTEVAGDTLTLSTDGDLDPSGELAVNITVPALDALALHGASRGDLRDARGDRLTVEASGASSVSGAGELASLVVRLSGASDADLGALRAAAIELTASGASTATVYATEALDVVASGASDVTQAGPGRIRHLETSGASTVETTGGQR